MGYGTWKLFSEVCIQAFLNFNVDCSIIHQDTTSVNVWGEYKPGAGDPMQINHGYSKDKRPDPVFTGHFFGSSGFSVQLVSD